MQNAALEVNLIPAQGDKLGSRKPCRKATRIIVASRCPYQPDEMALRTLLTAKTLEEGGLVQRLPKIPSEPRKLTPQQQQEVRARLKVGEPQASIARGYNVDVDTIRRLAR
jgi:hypothetical protein